MRVEDIVSIQWFEVRDYNMLWYLGAILILLRTKQSEEEFVRGMKYSRKILVTAENASTASVLRDEPFRSGFERPHQRGSYQSVDNRRRPLPAPRPTYSGVPVGMLVILQEV
jgi:hypothetical protein